MYGAVPAPARHLRPRTPPREIIHVRRKGRKVYDVTLQIRGIFEPTIIKGGETPYAEHPYFKVGGTVDAIDWSHWHIEVSEPKQTYWLNHYPKFSHTIYKEDYEATIPVAAGATVVVRVIDGNNRQIDNGKTGAGSPADHRGRGGQAARGSDVASRRGPRQSALTRTLNPSALKTSRAL